MAPWNGFLSVTPGLMKLLITDARGDDLKARLPSPPDHPRATLTLLEGIALSSGHAIPTVISVAGRVDDSLGLGPLDGHWPHESALVRLDFAEPRRCRLDGLGDFRLVRRLGRYGA